MAAGPSLAIVGPTASGKTALAIELARRGIRAGRQVELISVDSMAVYRGMAIGTAVPTAAELGDISLHCTGFVEPSLECSMVEFVAAARSAADDAAIRGAEVVFVGGTGLYVRALVDRLEAPGQYPDVAAALHAEPDTAVLYQRLLELDPVAAGRMESTNRRRIVRALEVTIGSGRPFSSFGPGLTEYPATNVLQIGLSVDRSDLSRRITARLQSQLERGFLDEVAALRSRPDRWSRTAAQALGYAELAAYLDGECTLDDAIERTVQRTRQLAVRQDRWFRRDPRIVWMEADSGAQRLADEVESLWRSSGGPSASTPH
ncbi:MAG: tRNA (adenosine(37)-N6)-dimethylallyltransferase MiaA [Actinomycetes bacterium]